ncbi:MAG: MBL fold metallo-hydrolase, partial [Anaerolineae bacterium]|nr:MBL fold metallo-hydrolase [Anaerolineae bacterium]
MELTWYGHATWKVRIGDTGIIIDPFFNHNPVSPVKAEDVDAQYIVLTHGHGDHMGDTDIIARHTGATIIANAEI